MPNLGPRSENLFSRLAWLGPLLFAGVWSAGTLYLDYLLFLNAHSDFSNALFYLMIATPLNMVMGGLIWMTVQLQNRTAHRAMPRIDETAGYVRIKLGPTPFAASGLVLFVSSIIGAITIAICMNAKLPVVLSSILAWFVVLALAVLTHVRMRHLTALGHYDITLDLTVGNLTLPPMVTKGEQLVIPFANVESIRVVEWRNAERQTCYLAILNWRDDHGEVRKLTLKESTDRETIEALVACIQADVTRRIETNRNESLW